MAASPWRGRPPKRPDGVVRPQSLLRQAAGAVSAGGKRAVGRIRSATALAAQRRAAFARRDWRTELKDLPARIRPRARFAAWREDIRAEVALWPNPVSELRAGWARATPPLRFAFALAGALALPAAAVLVALVPAKVIDATRRAADGPVPRRDTEAAGPAEAQPDRGAPTVAASPPPDLLAGQPNATVAWLTAAAPDAPQPIMLFPYVTPATFCGALEKAGLPGAVFRMDDPPQTGWTCVTDLIKPIPGDEAEASSLFVSARGLTANSLSIVRFKLNLLDAQSARLVKRLARQALRQVYDLLGFKAEERPLQAIETLADQTFVIKGVTYELRREYGMPLRVNMIVTFPRTLGAPAPGAFRPIRRSLLAPVRPTDAAEDDAADDAAAPL